MASGSDLIELIEDEKLRVVADQFDLGLWVWGAESDEERRLMIEGGALVISKMIEPEEPWYGLGYVLPILESDSSDQATKVADPLDIEVHWEGVKIGQFNLRKEIFLDDDESLSIFGDLEVFPKLSAALRQLADDIDAAIAAGKEIER